MKNYIVVHVYRDRTISRYDFGESDVAAVSFADKLWSEYKDMKNANLHEVVIIEEFSKQVLTTFCA